MGGIRGIEEFERQRVRFRDMARLLPERRREWLKWSIYEMERQAKRLARSGGVFSVRATGKLAASLRGVVQGTTSAMLTVGVKYGLIQDQGGRTRPHRIEPRFKKALAFPTGAGHAATTLRVRLGAPRKSGGDFLYHANPVRFAPGVAAKLGAKGALTGTTVVRGVNHPGSTIPGTHYSWKAWLAAKDYVLELGLHMLSGGAVRKFSRGR